LPEKALLLLVVTDRGRSAPLPDDDEGAEVGLVDEACVLGQVTSSMPSAEAPLQVVVRHVLASRVDHADRVDLVDLLTPT